MREARRRPAAAAAAAAFERLFSKAPFKIEPTKQRGRVFAGNFEVLRLRKSACVLVTAAVRRASETHTAVRSVIGLSTWLYRVRCELQRFKLSELRSVCSFSLMRVQVRWEGSYFVEGCDRVRSFLATLIS